jgi:hypothetical protein
MAGSDLGPGFDEGELVPGSFAVRLLYLSSSDCGGDWSLEKRALDGADAGGGGVELRSSIGVEVCALELFVSADLMCSPDELAEDWLLSRSPDALRFRKRIRSEDDIC